MHDVPLEQAARALEHAPHVGSTDVHPSSFPDTERTQHARASALSRASTPRCGSLDESPGSLPCTRWPPAGRAEDPTLGLRPAKECQHQAGSGTHPDVAAPIEVRRRFAAFEQRPGDSRCGEIRRDHTRTFLRTAGPARGEPILLPSTWAQRPPGAERLPLWMRRGRRFTAPRAFSGSTLPGNLTIVRT
jgi:hypothetical protein